MKQSGNELERKPFELFPVYLTIEISNKISYAHTLGGGGGIVTIHLVILKLWI